MMERLPLSARTLLSGTAEPADLGSDRTSSAVDDAPAIAQPETLDDFVAVHYRRLVRLAGIVCVDQTDAQDAVQNALERAWRHRASLRSGQLVRPWLDAIVVRESIRINGRVRSVMRGLTRRLTAVDADALPDVEPPRVEFVEALRRLPPAQRSALALHYEAGYTVAEIAGLVGVPVETVRSRLRLARERLRTALGEGRDGIHGR